MRIDLGLARLPLFTLHAVGGYYWIRVFGYGFHVMDDRRVDPVMRNLYSARGKRRWFGRFVLKGLAP